MRIGYPCVNLSIGCSSSRTFRLASYSEQRLITAIDENLRCLVKILDYNARHNILFFRITSDLVPFASHPVCTVPWQRHFKERFRDVGAVIRNHRMRVSMHPDQFNVINSPDETVFLRTVRELTYHAELLDLLEIDLTARIQIHVGGLYRDRERSIKRCIARLALLPEIVKRRLAIENDERLFTVQDCLKIHGETGVPVVFDSFHFTCNPGNLDMRTALTLACSSWKNGEGPPIVDYSTQEPGKRPGSHASAIDLEDFSRFLEMSRGIDFDVMLEIKDKETSALKALRTASELRFG